MTMFNQFNHDLLKYEVDSLNSPYTLKLKMNSSMKNPKQTLSMMM